MITDLPGNEVRATGMNLRAAGPAYSGASGHVRAGALQCLLCLGLMAVISPAYAAPQLEGAMQYVVLVGALVAICMGAFCAINAGLPEFGILFLFTLEIFQNIALGLANPPDAPLGTYVIAFTSVAAIALVFVTIASLGLSACVARLRRERLWILVLCYVLYLLLTVGNGLLSGAGLRAVFGAGRNMSVWLAIFVMGISLPNMDASGYRRFRVSFALLAVLVILFGFIERFLFSLDVWRDVLNAPYVGDSKLLTYYYWAEGLPMDFFTTVGGGRFIRRMTSLFVTSVTLGYFLAFTFLLSLFSLDVRVKRRLFFAAVLGVALFCAFARGSWFLSVTGIGAGIVLWYRPAMKHRTFMILFAVFVAIGVFAGLSILSQHASVWLHVRGLTMPFKTSRSLLRSLIGHGLGTGGSAARLLADKVAYRHGVTDLEVGAESTIGSIFYQTGFLGLGLYASLFFAMWRRLRHYYNQFRFRSKVLAGAALVSFAHMCGLLANSLLQANAIAPIPSSFYMAYCGLVLAMGGMEEDRTPPREPGKQCATSA